MPRMMTKRPSPVSEESDTPGMRPSASAALKSGNWAMVSADWTLTRLGAWYWRSRARVSWRGAVTTTSPTVAAWDVEVWPSVPRDVMRPAWPGAMGAPV